MINQKIVSIKKVRNNNKKSPACRVLNKPILDDLEIEDNDNDYNIDSDNFAESFVWMIVMTCVEIKDHTLVLKLIIAKESHWAIVKIW